MTTVTIAEVPLTGQSQMLGITLAGVSYQTTLIWRGAVGYVMDLADVNGNALVQGIPLVTGTDLLGPYPFLNVGGQLRVATDGADAAPTYTNLGTSSHLYFLVVSD